ncbi:MAG: hypothetical protein K8F54_11805 [Altibacter sp.]|uniref:hypothetical protein n=1 Tax=Altibacter sp. TaxID=2024823 RepID=UPI001D4EB0CB|nr:hypothetical protein [Altibacter sp.]MBZ0328284.1 hypothetical protein [Altibacter sp.]
MQIFYDNKRYYPYLCINDASDEQLKKIVAHLKNANLAPKKFYTDPKYSASDGVSYSYMFKLPFTDDKITKPSSESINELLNEFITNKKESKKADDSVINKELSIFIESEKKYLNQIKTLLDSERIILETDKEFFREQLDKLGKLTKSLQQENNRIIDFFGSISSKISEDIDNLFKKKSLDSEELKVLQSNIEKKEQLLIERELNIKKIEKDFATREKDFEQYKLEQEKNFKERIDSIRASNIGLNISEENQNEDTLKKIKILIIGGSTVNKSGIIKIFKETFERNIELTLPNSSIIVPTTDYDKMKNINILNYFKKDFDYIILGPRPHSMKGIDLKKGPVTLKKEYKLKANIFSDNNSKLSRNKLEELALQISIDWKSKNS